MSKIAFLGLGAMGRRMAQRCMAAGHTLTLYNRTSKAAEELVQQGAQLADSPRDAAHGAHFIISMVSNNQAAEAVWLDPDHGALSGAPVSALLIECSTLTPEFSARLGRQARMNGNAYLEAPVLGSRPQAEAGQLITLAAGSKEAYEKALPILKTYSGRTHHLGEIQQALIMKLVVNALLAIQTAAVGELLTMAEKSGLDRGETAELLSELPVTSPALQIITKLIAQKQYAPLFPIELVEKDLRYILANGVVAPEKLPTTQAVHQVYQAAGQKGFGGDNISGIAQLFD